MPFVVTKNAIFKEIKGLHEERVAARKDWCNIRKEVAEIETILEGMVQKAPDGTSPKSLDNKDLGEDQV